MTQDQLALMTDSRLSREARLMGLYVAAQGDGEHEIPHESFRLLLGRGARGLASDATLAGCVQELVSHGWIERKPGGRGSPRYLFTPTPERGIGPSEPEPAERSTPPPEGGKASTPPPAMGKAESSTHSSRGGKAVYPTPSYGQSVHVVVGGEEVVEEGVGEARGGARATLYQLDDRIPEILDDTDGSGEVVLAGCRDALRDYLRARVPSDRQHAYVRTVQAWLDGGPGAPRGLLDVDDPAHLVATALNDLGTEDETTFKSGRGQVGVVATLRTKIEHLVRQERRDGRGPEAPGATRAEPGGGGRRGPAQQVDVVR